MEQVIAYIITAVIGVTAISTFIASHLSKVAKYINIAKESVDVLDSVVKSVKDGKVDEVEVKDIITQINEWKAALKK